MRFFKTTRGIRHRKNRPKGTLPEANQLPTMMENIEEYVKQLSSNRDVVGITLAGGLSRGYGDQLSEIDLNLYLNEDRLQDWIKGRGPLPQGDHKGTKFHMDVSFLNLKAESTTDWSLLKKWDASYTKVLYDPTDIIEKFLDSKDVFTAEEKYSIALGNYLDCVYFGDIVVHQWLLRGDPLVANQMISKGIPALCNLLFLANDEYPPFEKWLVNYSYTLHWTPTDWKKRLGAITLIKELTAEEVQRRSREFMQLYREVWGKIVGEEYYETGLLELDALDVILYVIREQPTLEEFKKNYDIKQLSYENLYKLADIKRINGVEHIVFDPQRFKDEQKKGFPGFLQWNREMLKHIDI
ncbi:DUF4037 domain-containing protein [Candidatus Bathyarchaeota archaeon]|nr:DUF4037 domain-containing protein [Candidatus Bathyarchaeota archaeon]